VPEHFRSAVFTAKDLTSVKPIVSAPPLKGFKHSVEPILAADKLRYVGEIIAMCVAPTRAEAEDIAATITLEFAELPVVTDMLAASGATMFSSRSARGDRVRSKTRPKMQPSRSPGQSGPRGIACFRWKAEVSSPIAMRGWGI
jgi:aerobic carbon-monoxide dehydrogenase large subunit